MTWDTRNGRSVETIRAELEAIESQASSRSDPALGAYADHLRREHQAARRSRQRELEDDFLTMPEGADYAFGTTPRA